jgi:hypothetical protein
VCLDLGTAQPLCTLHRPILYWLWYCGNCRVSLASLPLIDTPVVLVSVSYTVPTVVTVTTAMLLLACVDQHTYLDIMHTCDQPTHTLGITFQGFPFYSYAHSDNSTTNAHRMCCCRPASCIPGAGLLWLPIAVPVACCSTSRLPCSGVHVRGIWQVVA